MNLRSLFPDFDDPLIEYLSNVGEQAFSTAGELLLRPGQYPKGTILILDGLAKVYLEGEKGEEVFLYFLEKGDACALSIICSTTESDIKVKAVTDIKALIVPFGHMDAMIKNFPKWYHFLLETYHYRFCELLKTLNQIAFRSMDEKLIIYLKQQFAALHTKTIHTTHQAIASDLNSSREVISRLLKKLESDNLIALNRNEITNRNLDR